MTRGRYRAAFIPGLVALVATLGAAAGTAASQTVARAARVPRATAPVAFNCGHAQIRPRSFVLTCGDGNSYLTSLTWFDLDVSVPGRDRHAEDQ